MEASLAAVHAGISNYTCQLRVMGLIDDNLNINLNEAINQYVNIPIDSYLREDLVLSVRYCKEQSDRMPLELLTVPSPTVFRILSFAKCERKLRRFSCLKKDLRDNINLVEFSAIPDIGGAGPIDNLAIILTAAGTLDELDFF
ncbi:uncharacterized protein LOC121854503 [Homarus americanus]|uniref:uncharacterized protein LOC121854503 n=1 Tax=Homarus americanus TaxID=6706 RepID=UPI001C45CB12|nr:uncharacterized protein LOC121854503 [Homarus americanus]